MSSMITDLGKFLGDPDAASLLAQGGGGPLDLSLWAGRLLRADSLPEEEAASLEAWVCDLSEPDISALRDRVIETAQAAPLSDARSPLACLSALEARDDLESALWISGLLAMEGRADAGEIEAELRALTSLLDGAPRPSAEALRPLLKDAPRPSWLVWLAGAGCVGWWITPLLLGLYAEDTRRFFERPSPDGEVEAPLPLPMWAWEPAPPSFGAPTVEEALARPLSAPIARICDDTVEIYAVGLAEHDDGPAGLVVRDAEGRLERLREVRLSPPGPSAPVCFELARAWWVPLEGASEARELLVEILEPGRATGVTARLPLTPPSP